MKIPETTQAKIAKLTELVGHVRELESREAAKNSLLGYAKFQMDNYKLR